MIPHDDYMREAIRLAREAAIEGQHAVGAVVVGPEGVVSTGKTSLRFSTDPTLHAEIVAIRAACALRDDIFLKDCVLYTTHEPCPMCASAAIWARMQGIVFGALLQDGLDYSRAHSTDRVLWRQIALPCKDVLAAGNPKLELVEGFLREECTALFSLTR
jgi:tRNA(Arg) A34 adenosine deaminase TadA